MFTSLRRYQRLCARRPAGQEPQCWEAETEIGEAWRAMPFPIRAWLCLRVGAVRDALWELPRGRASTERAELLNQSAQMVTILADIHQELEQLHKTVEQIQADRTP